MQDVLRHLDSADHLDVIPEGDEHGPTDGGDPLLELRVDDSIDFFAAATARAEPFHSLGLPVPASDVEPGSPTVGVATTCTFPARMTASAAAARAEIRRYYGLPAPAYESAEIAARAAAARAEIRHRFGLPLPASAAAPSNDDSGSLTVGVAHTCVVSAGDNSFPLGVVESGVVGEVGDADFPFPGTGRSSPTLLEIQSSVSTLLNQSRAALRRSRNRLLDLRVDIAMACDARDGPQR